MIYSSSKGFLFCHVPKTGGTSIRKQIEQYRRPEESSYIYKLCRRFGFADTYPFYDFFHRPHTTLSKAKLLLGEKAYAKLFVFAVAREPVDWLCSCYKFFRLGNSTIKGRKTNKINSFSEYVDAMISLEHSKPCQAYLLIDNTGALLVDAIGHFDHLETFCSQIHNKLGFNAIKLPHLNTNNFTANDLKADIATNSSLEEKIKRAWALDFEIWDLVQEKSSDLRYHKLHHPISAYAKLTDYDPWGMFNW